ncbi:hypothetical protein D9M72_399230 [compost metagenome]
MRAQYETLDRWNGNQRGSSMISTGIIGTADHGITPYSASSVRVNTLLASAPPMAWMAWRARAMCGACGSSPAIFSAKYAFTLALRSALPSWNSGQPPSACWIRRR